MRLLHTTSITVKEFVGQNIPSYAILSHTWDKEEVLLVDIQNATARYKKGYSKITGCCRKAAEHGFEWIWVDTCCIDKTSSAELSEAINSMYRWYELSTICYVYLQDVRVAEGADALFRGTQFGESRWFTRGWTLQELLAPRAVEFYSVEWREIGTKDSLALSLSSVTGIPIHILNGNSPASCSVAERMSWASTRQTTREEDIAYCLLGLFGVNMPLLYGEGPKAFIRLQEQILKQEEDYTVFTWTLQHDCGDALTGFLASTPREFSNLVPGHLQPPTLIKKILQIDTAADFEQLLLMKKEYRKYIHPQTFSSQFGTVQLDYSVLHDKNYKDIRKYDMQSDTAEYLPRHPPVLTSRGLLLTLPVMNSKDPALPVIAWVYCELEGKLLCVGLRPCATSSRLRGRQAAPWLMAVDKSCLADFKLEEILLHPNGLIQHGRPTDPALDGSFLNPPLGRLRILTTGNQTYSLHVILAYPMDRWSLDEFFFQSTSEMIGTALIECASAKGSSRFIVASGIRNEHPWCTIAEVIDSEGRTDTSLLESLFLEMLNDKELRSNHSDRTACISDNMPETILTSAIRRVPQPQRKAHAYSLQMGVHGLAHHDPWVRLCYNQNKVAKEMKSGPRTGF